MAPPGITLGRLLEGASDDTIRSLLGKPLLNLLEMVDATLLQGSKLRQVVGKLRDPASLLTDRGSRRILLSLLIPAKREELAVRCGLSSDTSVDALCDEARSPATLSKLLSFFGIDEDEKVIGARAPT
ncbi:MAG TPA: hypothetical protein VEF04_03330, partial [Blastocatellia bacterium]|nr:hypothetical protein [Blastocatellia bacterium]